MRERRKTPSLLILLSLAIGTSALLAFAKKKDSKAEVQMEAPKRALHALNRLTFGPAPGDVERVAKMGVDRWIDLELHPDKIDDRALEARLAPFRTLRMDTKEIVENFPPFPRGKLNSLPRGTTS